MRKQEQVRKHKDNFNKSQGVEFGDNKQDEMMADVLVLYPHQQLYMLAGDNSGQVRAKLKKEVRQYFDKLQLNDTMLSANGGRNKRKGLQKVGKTIMRASLVVPRGSALILIKVNYRGLAKRFSLLTEDAKQKLYTRWEDLGGKTDKLTKAIEEGKNRPLFVCGKKCRAKYGAKPQIPIQKEEYSNVAGGDDLAIGALIASGLGVITALINQIGTGKNANKSYKNQKDLMQLQADIAQKQREEDAIDATMSPSERKIAEEIVKAQNSGFDPKLAIQNNPNLTADEKAEAIKQLEGATKSKIGIDTGKKYLLIGAVLVLAYVGWEYYKSTKTQS